MAVKEVRAAKGVGSSPLKVAVLMNLLSPWSRDLVLRLARRGLNVVVVDLREGPGRQGYLSGSPALHKEAIRELEEAASAIHQIHSAHASPLRFLSAAWELRKFLATQKPDVLLTLYGGGYTTAAWLSGFRPFVVLLVGSDVHLVKGLSRRVIRLALRNAQVVLANGQSLASAASQTFGLPCVHSLYLGVDTRRFHPLGRAKNERIRALCTRGFESIYNNLSIIEAVADWPADAPAVELIFASTGSLLPRARELAGRLSAGPRVRVTFCGGVSGDALVELLRCADIFVSMSRSDGTSASLLEALACGVFPVLSDIPANQEWISEREVNGFLVPLDNVHALTYALVRAAREGALRQRAAVANRALIMSRADADVCTDALIEELMRAVGAP